MNENRLFSTKETAKKFRMSEYELRKGWKEGRFPAYEIGSGRGTRLRWNLNLLEMAIMEQMQNAQASRREVN